MAKKTKKTAPVETPKPTHWKCRMRVGTHDGGLKTCNTPTTKKCLQCHQSVCTAHSSTFGNNAIACIECQPRLPMPTAEDFGRQLAEDRLKKRLIIRLKFITAMRPGSRVGRSTVIALDLDPRFTADTNLLKTLWNIERTLNELPSNVRTHIEIDEEEVEG